MENGNVFTDPSVTHSCTPILQTTGAAASKKFAKRWCFNIIVTERKADATFALLGHLHANLRLGYHTYITL